MVDNSQNLSLRQKQSLVMTPQLQLSLKLLQFSTQEISDYVSKEIEKNPLLVMDDSESKSKNDVRSESKKTDNNTEKDVVDRVQEINHLASEDSPLDVNHDNTWNNSREGHVENFNPKKSFEEKPKIGSGGSNNSDFDKNSFLEQTLSEETTLREHLLEQINVDFDDQAKKMIAVHLLDLLDDNGYIDFDAKALAELFECEESLIKETLANVQRCDPAGVFARSLKECLALQLKDKDRFDPAMERLVENLELIAKGEFKALKRICGVDQDDLSEMCDEIKALNPKPGKDFIPEIVHTIHLDIFLTKSEESEDWELELNNETLPKVLINNKYHSEVKKRAKNDYEKKYISEQINTANWLIKTLHQRAETILKVATEIVKQQHEFFEKGIHFLKPLVLRDIAEALDMHESTVGRVTTNKYISTPRGVYELKFFFSSSINSSSGDGDYSSKTVKHFIEELIKQENAKVIFSDDKIAEMLKEQGVNIARRTVAKYREAMNIPSSVERRQQKRIEYKTA